MLEVAAKSRSTRSALRRLMHNNGLKASTSTVRRLHLEAKVPKPAKEDVKPLDRDRILNTTPCNIEHFATKYAAHCLATGTLSLSADGSSFATLPDNHFIVVFDEKELALEVDVDGVFWKMEKLGKHVTFLSGTIYNSKLGALELPRVLVLFIRL